LKNISILFQLIIILLYASLKIKIMMHYFNASQSELILCIIICVKKVTHVLSMNTNELAIKRIKYKKDQIVQHDLEKILWHYHLFIVDKSKRTCSFQLNFFAPFILYLFFFNVERKREKMNRVKVQLKRTGLSFQSLLQYISSLLL